VVLNTTSASEHLHPLTHKIKVLNENIICFGMVDVNSSVFYKYLKKLEFCMKYKNCKFSKGPHIF